MDTKTEHIMRPDEAAKYLGLTRSYLYSLLGNGVIDSRYERGKRLIRKSDLDRFLEARAKISF